MAARPRLFDFNAERSKIITEASERVVAEKEALAEASSRHGLEYVLNEAAFHEIERLKKYGADENIGEVGGLGFWRGLAKRVGTAGEGEKREVLRKLVRAYMSDLAGNFDPRVYQIANKAVPFGLSLLFNAQGDASGVRRFRRLRERVVLEGAIDRIAKLADKGTLIVAPTHLSNLDSIVIGWALMESGLPPVTYGAGKNLFSNPLLSYFMQNLGAYKVDRRIRHQLYKTCLKAYSEVLIEWGFHSLFFPGGTRARSGEVEQRLKLGLLGTGTTAYIRSHRDGKDQPIYIVPMTLNMNLVLEAQGLIDDHLRLVGKEMYFLPDDPFENPMEVVKFVMKLATMETSMVIRFGEPMDILGHKVDDDGVSYDQLGRPIDLEPFFEVKPGVVDFDGPRDREYTRQAGEAVARAFVENTVVMPTQLLAHVLFQAAKRNFPRLDIVSVIRFAAELQVPWDEVNADAAALKTALMDLEAKGGVQLLGDIKRKSVPELIDTALQAFEMYHTPPVAEATGQGIRLLNTNVLCYYSNRLNCMNLSI